MGSIKDILDPSDGGQDIGGMIDPGGKTIKTLTGSDIGRQLADPAGVIPEDPRPGREAAEAARRKLLAKQKQKEQLLLAERESEVARRRFVGTGRRSLLIATSPTGTQTLGGT